ncbi:MAG: MFS transporter, partial [Candidatus Binatia bacterium]
MSGAWAMIIPTIPVLASEFGVSAGGAAQIVTATAIGKFFGTVLAGVLLDRTGTRLALVGGPLAGCIAALLCAVVPWFAVMLVLSLCIGAADSLGATAREFTALDLARRNQRGRLISSMHGTHNIGAAIAPFVGGWLTEVFSFKAAFVGYGVSCALMALLGEIGPHSAALPSAQRSSAPARGRDVAALHRRLRGLLLLFREIRPDLRTTFVALVLATMASQSQRIIVQSMLPLYA